MSDRWHVVDTDGVLYDTDLSEAAAVRLVADKAAELPEPGEPGFQPEYGYTAVCGAGTPWAQAIPCQSKGR